MVPTCGCSTARTPCSAATVRVGRGCPAASPSRRRRVRAGVVAVQPGDRGQHQHLGVGGVIRVEDPVDLRERVVAGLVQEHGGEPADGGQAASRTWAICPGRPAGIRPGPSSVADRPTSRISASTRSGRELVAPVGDLADAPGDRCAGNRYWASAHCRTSSICTGRCCCRDRVAASAIQATSTASSTVHGEARRPSTTSVNALSSARKALGEPVHEERGAAAPAGKVVAGFEVAHAGAVVPAGGDAVGGAVQLQPAVVAAGVVAGVGHHRERAVVERQQRLGGRDVAGLGEHRVALVGCRWRTPRPPRGRSTQRTVSKSCTLQSRKIPPDAAM